MTLTSEQLAMRKGKMTSSVVAGALGLDPHMTPLQAWIAITGRDTFAGSKATARGDKLEDVTLDSVLDAHPDLKRFDAPFVDGAIFGRPWSGDSTDALYGRSRRKPVLIGEGKTAAMVAAKSYGAEGTDEVPTKTLVQSHWHLIHWPEVERCAVPALVGGFRFEFRLYYVQRDVELEGRLSDLAHKFYVDHVLTDMPPEASANDGDAISRLFPTSNAAPLVADEEITRLALDYDAARSALKEAEARKDQIGNALKMALGPHQGAANGHVSITYAQQRPRVKTEWMALAVDLGITAEQIGKHSTQVPGSRPLTVKIKER